MACRVRGHVLDRSRPRSCSNASDLPHSRPSVLFPRSPAFRPIRIIRAHGTKVCEYLSPRRSAPVCITEHRVREAIKEQKNQSSTSPVNSHMSS